MSDVCIASGIKARDSLEDLCGLAGVEALELEYATPVYLSTLEVHANLPPDNPMR